MNDFSPAAYDLPFFDLPFFGMASSAYEGWAETALQQAADAGSRPVFPWSVRAAQEQSHE
jgi:hypothetical protein